MLPVLNKLAAQVNKIISSKFFIMLLFPLLKKKNPHGSNLSSNFGSVICSFPVKSLWVFLQVDNESYDRSLISVSGVHHNRIEFSVSFCFLLLAAVCSCVLLLAANCCYMQRFADDY